MGEELTIDKQFRDNVQACNATIIELSSTFIRSGIQEGKNMKAFLPYGVYEYIVNHKLYL